MTASNELEEVELELPKLVYENLRDQNEIEEAETTTNERRSLVQASKKSFASKIMTLLRVSKDQRVTTYDESSDCS